MTSTGDRTMSDIRKCPVMGHGQQGGGTSNSEWWPDQLKLNILQSLF